jgi:acyl-CoA-binding protein
MRASQLLSLLFGLGMAIEVTSLPILESGQGKSEDESQLTKRGKKSKKVQTEEEQLQDYIRHVEHQRSSASYVKNANSHLSTAAAHAVAAASKVVTMPAAGIVGTGRNVVDMGKGVVNRDTGLIKESAASGILINPVATVYKTIKHPIHHSLLATGHFGAALKNYANYGFAALSDKNYKTRYPHELIQERKFNAWKNVVRDPLDHAMHNAIDITGYDEHGRALYGQPE